MNDVLAKEEVVLNQVIDESAKKNDVSPGADRHPNIGQRARARETWIDMDDRGALLFRFHHPAKTHRVRFGHRGTFDQNAICVSEILLRGCSSARPKEVPRPGTVLLCHIRAWLDTQTMPRPPVKSF